jgi:hypothetical protein
VPTREKGVKMLSENIISKPSWSRNELKPKSDKPNMTQFSGNNKLSAHLRPRIQKLNIPLKYAKLSNPLNMISIQNSLSEIKDRPGKSLRHFKCYENTTTLDNFGPDVGYKAPQLVCVTQYNIIGAV